LIFFFFWSSLLLLVIHFFTVQFIVCFNLLHLLTPPFISHLLNNVNYEDLFLLWKGMTI
jgi:hypothetical protein